MKYITSVLVLFLLVSCNLREQKNQGKSNDITSETAGIIDNKTADSSVQKNKIDRQKQIEELREIIRQFPELDNYSLYTDNETFFIKGDFYGDNVEDIALFLKDISGVRLCIINFGDYNRIKILGDVQGQDIMTDYDYSWVGKFKKVNKGEILWSNYEDDDFRNFEDVPENEKVKLNYDAIYVHAFESCGGGFIFWKDNKFNWLQQE